MDNNGPKGLAPLMAVILSFKCYCWIKNAVKVQCAIRITDCWRGFDRLQTTTQKQLKSLNWRFLQFPFSRTEKWKFTGKCLNWVRCLQHARDYQVYFAWVDGIAWLRSRPAAELCQQSVSFFSLAQIIKAWRICSSCQKLVVDSSRKPLALGGFVDRYWKKGRSRFSNKRENGALF